MILGGLCQCAVCGRVSITASGICRVCSGLLADAKAALPAESTVAE